MTSHQLSTSRFFYLTILAVVVGLVLFEALKALVDFSVLVFLWIMTYLDLLLNRQTVEIRLVIDWERGRQDSVGL